MARLLGEYRAREKLTGLQLCERLQISEPHLIAMTRHGKAPGLEILKKLARFFEWTPEEVGAITMYSGPPPKKGKRRDAA